MNCIVEQIERSQCVFVPVLNLLCSLLEAREHGTLAARQMFTGITVFADFSKDLLHQNELIRDKGKISGELAGTSEALNVQHCIGEGKQIPQH